MPLMWVCQEWDESLKDGQSPSVETVWQVVTDSRTYPITSARTDLLNHLAANGLMQFSNLPLTDIEVVRLRASKCFRATCTYGMRQIAADGNLEFTVDARPETRRQLMSLSTVNALSPPGRVAPTLNGFLGVKADARPEGVDIPISVKTYNVQVWWSGSRFVAGQPSSNYQTLQNYVDLLDSLEGCVNSEYFAFSRRGLIFRFQPGECQLASSRLSEQGLDLWQLDIELKKKKNYIDPILSLWAGAPYTVEGWDEVNWPSTTTTDTASATLVPKPTGGVVQRTLFRGDLNQLLVPVPP